MDPIVVFAPQLFSVTSADGKTGPKISVATFRQPNPPDPKLSGPHFLIDGQITLLGIGESTFVSVSRSGFDFALKGPLMPGVIADVQGHFDVGKWRGNDVNY